MQSVSDATYVASFKRARVNFIVCFNFCFLQYICFNVKGDHTTSVIARGKILLMGHINSVKKIARN